MDSSIHRINHYAVDTYERNQLHYPLDRDLSGGWRYPAFEQLGPALYRKPGVSNWNLKSTFHGQGIQNPVPAIPDLQHKIRNPQRAIQKPRFSLIHLILEECQPVSRRVSFHKRRSSVRKREKDAIGSHLIQAGDNVPQKLKFHFLNFPYCIAKFHMSYRSSNSSQSRLHREIL